MVDLTHMGSGKTYLVAVTRIAGCGFAGDDLLRQFARKRLVHRCIDVAGTRHAHRLIDISSSGQRVTDGTAQTGTCTAKRLYLCRVVMGLVLELQKPFLCLSVHVHVNEDRAGIVLFAYLHIVQQTLLLEVTGTDSSQLHEAQRLLIATQLRTNMVKIFQFRFYIVFDERVLYLDIFKDSGERSVTAVVRPVGIEDTQLRLRRVAVLVREVVYHAFEVISVHRQSPLLAEVCVLLTRHSGEACQRGQRFHFARQMVIQDAQVFLARLYSIDIIMTDARQVFIAQRVFEDKQAARTDVDIGIRVYQVHAVNGGRSALVELTGDVLHSQIALALQRQRIAYRVGYSLTENAVLTFLQQFIAEPEQVIHAQVAKLLKMQLQIFVQFAKQTLCLYAKSFPFLYKKTMIHIR